MNNGASCSMCKGDAQTRGVRTPAGAIVVVKLCPRCDRRQCTNEDCKKHIQGLTAQKCPHCGESLAYDPSG